MEFVCKRFADLTTRELYEVLRLRADVFVVEQECAYLDPDGIDLRAEHLLGRVDGGLAAYLRWFDEDGDVRVGRIVTSRAARGSGLGHRLMEEVIARLPGRRLVLHGQAHLDGFYERHGFRTVGEPFPEDGIPHVRMVRDGEETP